MAAFVPFISALVPVLRCHIGAVLSGHVPFLEALVYDLGRGGVNFLGGGAGSGGGERAGGAEEDGSLC
eukprot:2720687-Rhodomonas_salina.1